MMGLHQVHIRVAPGLWRGIAWPTTPAIAQIKTSMIRVPSMVIPAQEQKTNRVQGGTEPSHKECSNQVYSHGHRQAYQSLLIRLGWDPMSCLGGENRSRRPLS